MGIEKNGIGKGFDAKQEDKWRFKVAQEIHLKNFYRSFYNYLEHNEYVGMYGDNKFEIYYDEMHHPNGTKEYRIRWRAYHKVANSKYVILKFTFDWLILKCLEKQVVVNGKKLKMQHGEVEITCKTSVLVNKNSFRGNPLLRPFTKLFFDRWFRYLYEGYKDNAKKRSKAIEEKIKSLFALKGYGPGAEKEFNRSQGFRDPSKKPELAN